MSDDAYREGTRNALKLFQGGDPTTKESGNGKSSTSTAGSSSGPQKSQISSAISGMKFRKVPGASSSSKSLTKTGMEIFNPDDSNSYDSNDSDCEVVLAKEPNTAQAISAKKAVNDEAEIDELEDDEEEEPIQKARVSNPTPSTSSTSTLTEKNRMKGDNIWALWNQEVSAPSTGIPQDWSPIKSRPALTKLLSKKDELIKLQREAGRDRNLDLEARRMVALKLSAYVRKKGRAKCTFSYNVARLHGFCVALDIPMFPMTDAMLALYEGVTTRTSKAKDISKKNLFTSLRSMVREPNELWRSNDAFSKLYYFEGAKEALEEVLIPFEEPQAESSTSREVPATQTINVDEVELSVESRRQEEAPATQMFNVDESQQEKKKKKKKRKRSTLEPESEHLRRLKESIEASRIPLTKQHSNMFEKPSPAQEEDQDLDKRQRLNSPIALEHPAPSDESTPLEPYNTVLQSLPPTTRRSPQEPPHASSLSSRSLPPPSISAAVTPQKTPPPVRIEEEPSSLPSPALSASTPADRQPSPLPPPPAAPTPAPSRVYLAAQSVLESNQTSVPLPLSSLQAFFSALDPSLVFIAEPLHKEGIDTEEMLVNFVSFEMRTRVRFVVSAVKKSGSERAGEITPELLERLENALESDRD
ncbi:uncharacterized protein JCM6883_004941 [Sporobolomyces salmoneus]|uniref:uncharacterized protein n=1 Tax=Sporobolomyces salmoneus TaxID=183962 RepID=UPI00317A2E01